MNVFDFDGTLYRGESSVDLALFLMRDNHAIVGQLPSIFWNLFLYKRCLASRQQLEHAVNRFLKTAIRDGDDFNRLIALFWTNHQHKLNFDLVRRIRPEDVILTAGPRLLIEGIADKLHTRRIIGSEIDLSLKCLTWFNFGSRKVVRYKMLCGGETAERFFTDSFNDRAMMEIARRVYLVNDTQMQRLK